LRDCAGGNQGNHNAARLDRSYHCFLSSLSQVLEPV
jgi:hypothetical protein